MKFKWTGREGWKVGDAGGETRRMSRLTNSYECSEFGGKVKEWLAKGWIEVIDPKPPEVSKLKIIKAVE
jgi:hypothetical protein